MKKIHLKTKEITNKKYLDNKYLVEVFYSPFWLTSLIYVKKFEFENPIIMEDKQCKTNGVILCNGKSKPIIFCR